MKRAKRVGVLLGVVLAVLRAAGAESAAGTAGGVPLLEAPEGAKLIAIPLAVTEGPGGRPQGYLAQRSPQPLEELSSVPSGIAEAYSGKEFFAYRIAAFPDGTRYVVVLNQDTSIKFLVRNESAMWYARIYRVPGGNEAKPELLREGYQSAGGDVTVPVELALAGLGTTKVKSVRTEVGYNLSGFQNGKPQVYSGRGAALQVSGSHVVKEGKLTLTVTVPEELTVTPDTQVSLRFEPVGPGLPEDVATGKITDYLTLGSARFVVSALAPDFSSATLALAAGSLEQTLKHQLQVGTQMPPFAQVDLMTRKTVTQEELLARARGTAGVVFVFGDVAPPAGRYSPYGPPMRAGAALPLPPGEVAEQLSLQLQPKPVVVLITRQIGLDFLYEDLRNKTPEYELLADFVDPLRTAFRMPQSSPGPWYGPSYSSGQGPSLRQSFNLPANTLAVAAFSPQGKVLYVNADVKGEFLPALAEARSALKEAEKGRR